MEEFWSFRRMVAPVVIEVVFILGAIGTAVAGIVYFVNGLRDHDSREAVAGVALFLFGPLLARLYCEALVVVFRINETLSDLRELAVWASERAYARDEEESDEESPDA